jgi:hypothetical protein
LVIWKVNLGAVKFPDAELLASQFEVQAMWAGRNHRPTEDEQGSAIVQAATRFCCPKRGY